MAKGLRYVRRDRSTPGRAVGTLVCRVSLPALADPFDHYLSHPEELRRLLRRELPKTEAGLEGAWVSVSAAVRKPSRAIGRKKLERWSSGEPIDTFVEAVCLKWGRLPKEDATWSKTVEVDLPDSRPVGRRRKRRHKVRSNNQMQPTRRLTLAGARLIWHRWADQR